MDEVAYTLSQFNGLPAAQARAALMTCCKATRWVEQVLARRPFAQFDDLLIAADEAFAVLEPEDWQEAFDRSEPIDEEELPVVATEQMKVTNLSLRRIISDAV
jgi:2-oxo-4-hydroxy-4-carboxy-5-ureidoimidazoline decarboxylase